ncbi:MAG: NADH-quinone oxidoreductase subunit H [Clostridiales bacterium]|nr:NADH-quinone oxidoreductase subunit H [Clostridiales bacterium]
MINWWILFYILIFPGFLFCLVAAFLLSGIDRKLVARMQKRIGPPILQNFYDFMKLMGKETIIPHEANRAVFLAAPVVGLLALVTVVLFIPIYRFSAFGGIADVVVILYLLTVPAVALIVGGAASGSPYAGVGISREMVAVLSYELPLVMVLLAIGKKVGLALGENAVTFSMANIAAYQNLFGPLIAKWSMIPAALAMLLVIPCEVGCHPFDVAEAETEICEGPLVEYSGAPLGIFKLNYYLKMFVMTALFTALFLGGRGTGYIALDALVFFLCCVCVTAVSMSLVRAVTARLKVEQVFKFYWTVVAGLALISLVLAWFGL